MCRYRYYCPICGYMGNNTHYFHMRNNNNGHFCYPEDNPDYDGQCYDCGDCDDEDCDDEDDDE